MLVRFQLLLQPCNNVFAHSIYGTGWEVGRRNPQEDWDSDLRGEGHAATVIQAAWHSQNKHPGERTVQPVLPNRSVLPRALPGIGRKERHKDPELLTQTVRSATLTSI